MRRYPNLMPGYALPPDNSVEAVIRLNDTAPLKSTAITVLAISTLAFPASVTLLRPNRPVDLIVLASLLLAGWMKAVEFYGEALDCETKRDSLPLSPEARQHFGLPASRAHHSRFEAVLERTTWLWSQLATWTFLFGVVAWILFR